MKFFLLYDSVYLINIKFISFIFEPTTLGGWGLGCGGWGAGGVVKPLLLFNFH